jgi:hypothetical protein
MHGAYFPVSENRETIPGSASVTEDPEIMLGEMPSYDKGMLALPQTSDSRSAAITDFPGNFKSPIMFPTLGQLLQAFGHKWQHDSIIRRLHRN